MSESQDRADMRGGSLGSPCLERVEALLEDEIARADAVLIGPGLWGGGGTVRLVTAIVSMPPEDLPVVLDAAGATMRGRVDSASAKARPCGRR